MKNMWQYLGIGISVAILMPFILLVSVALTPYPVLFSAAAVFLLVEIDFALIRLTQYLRKQPAPPASKNKKTVRKTWLAAGAASVLASACSMAHDFYYDALESEVPENYTESQFDGELYRDYKPFHSQKTVKLPHAPALQFPEDGALPTMDGAKALYPVYASFAENIYPQNRVGSVDCLYYPYQTESPNPLINVKKQTVFVRCNNTIQSFEDLIEGKTDIVFLGKPSAQQMQLAEKKGVRLNMKPIGREAFVFFTHKNNPVDNLTQQNVKDIYSGKIRNWKDVGGKWQSIRPFQRNANSGSQSTMERLMGETPLMPPEERNYSGSMGGIIRSVAKYRNHANAIGYSFLFFVETLHANENIKILSIDGVYPDKNNIRNGSYPFAYPFYAITLEGRESAETKQLLQWLDSEDAKTIIEGAGYTAIRQ